MDLRNKVVLITGAGKGAGAALARAFAEQGALVALNDISPINVEQVAAEITAKGGKAKAYVEDIAKKVGVQYVIKGVEDDFGGMDILVNHAVVKPHTTLLDVDEWDWHRTLDVNLTGAFLTIQSAGRIMREKGHGAILNIVAEAGIRPESEAGAYPASMAGLVALSHQADRELSPLGIRVYAVENSADVVKNVIKILEAQ
ncbi:MAG TPA: SDR family NAD(P)-dependent oxidoreductase [Anaerolineales bacterium]|nr:SDR family NAD(P)-dependent oxidoreductase [Anaerolineales bacterium]HMV96164.1 SDR family NAD(P)-dependent oxidoreductase [Anaerolineales bacterium]HMX19230.1 SDR family NAD(P)-dependent oxidoreductase [Anaerolineales bacterium]HMX73980.1 SDR family NAD(P)-dependent oxidoreductase [Anaerolineales bacterium]HMZ42540.1 SDR family NAD(P)-dependent oxidoreductase [Anaerolineales bacterium]